MKREWKTWLPYIGIPVLCGGLVLVQRGRLDGAELLLRALLLVFGYVAAAGDLKNKRVPNRLVAVMAGAWVLVIVPQLLLRTEETLFLAFSGMVGFLLAGFIFLAVYLISRKGLGGGDVKLMAVSGLYLGFGGVLPTMLYGSVLAALTALALIALKKITVKDSIPLVPFLYVGMVLTLFIR